FKLFVSFLEGVDLIGTNIIAVDGRKIRGNNRKKNKYNAKKIARHLANIEEKMAASLAEFEATNASEHDELALQNLNSKLDHLATQQLKYEALQQQLDASNDPQVSTTDPDSRALLVRGVVVEVGYNVQAAVDEKHNLVVATHTINRNDKNALYDI